MSHNDILKEINQVGTMEARRNAGYDVDLSTMTSMNFEKKVRIGDSISFWATLTKIGTLSTQVRVEVTICNSQGSEEHVTFTDSVYVVSEHDLIDSKKKENNNGY